MEKTIITLISAIIIAIVLAAPAHADLTDMYGVDIKDSGSWDDAYGNLFQLFNGYFADQLGSNTMASSNQLFNTYGVDPTTDWTTNDSSVVGAFKVAALGHNFSVVSKENKILGSIFSVQGVVNLGEHVGIVDLGNNSVALADGHNIDFNLNATWNGASVYDWSSSGNNNDGAIHMIALNITELYNAKNGMNYDSVYMLCWEDMDLGNPATDWDYQDFVAIVTNIIPKGNSETINSSTPEPGTMLIFGVGLAGAAAWRRSKKIQK